MKVSTRRGLVAWEWALLVVMLGPVSWYRYRCPGAWIVEGGVHQLVHRVRRVGVRSAVDDFIYRSTRNLMKALLSKHGGSRVIESYVGSMRQIALGVIFMYTTRQVLHLLQGYLSFHPVCSR